MIKEILENIVHFQKQGEGGRFSELNIEKIIEVVSNHLNG